MLAEQIRVPYTVLSLGTGSRISVFGSRKTRRIAEAAATGKISLCDLDFYVLGPRYD